jgi:hypothetical protein
MPKSALVAGLAAVLCALPALGADESDVIGLWSVDTDALRSQMESMLERRFAELPDDQRAPALAMAKAQLEPMVGQMAGEAEFRPDGTVVFTSGTDPASYGTWSLDDDLLRFERDQRVANEPAYVGTVEDDVISARPAGREGNPNFTLTLRRTE